jgi:hypothetical protein
MNIPDSPTWGTEGYGAKKIPIFLFWLPEIRNCIVTTTRHMPLVVGFNHWITFSSGSGGIKDSIGMRACSSASQLHYILPRNWTFRPGTILLIIICFSKVQTQVRPLSSCWQEPRFLNLHSTFQRQRMYTGFRFSISEEMKRANFQWDFVSLNWKWQPFDVFHITKKTLFRFSASRKVHENRTWLRKAWQSQMPRWKYQNISRPQTGRGRTVNSLTGTCLCNTFK